MPSQVLIVPAPSPTSAHQSAWALIFQPRDLSFHSTPVSFVLGSVLRMSISQPDLPKSPFKNCLNNYTGKVFTTHVDTGK